MAPRTGLAVLALLAASAAAAQSQANDPAPVKAGDRAPNLTWTKVLAMDSAMPGPQSLTGETTVLFFLPSVTNNQHAVDNWNATVEHFAGKPVNFVWIAGEDAEAAESWLKQHPVRGWLVLDPQQRSSKDYGVELPCGVLIDPKGTLLGFTDLAPEEAQIQAALDGKSAGLADLKSQPNRVPPPPHKPNEPVSEEVRISPSQHTSGADSSTGPDYWVRRGFKLRPVIAEVMDTDATRVELPAALDTDAIYDFVLVLPHEEDAATMKRKVREGIEDFFHVTIAKAIRAKEVYLMTALPGRTPPAKPPSSGDGIATGFTAASVSRTIALPRGASKEELDAAEKHAMDAMQLASATAMSNTMAEFCKGLEDGLHRPVIDETKLTGRYDFVMKGQAGTPDEFLNMLRDQFGLVLTPAERSIEVTLVEPQGTSK